jgi:undecaprenyl-diphosphatase
LGLLFVAALKLDASVIDAVRRLDSPWIAQVGDVGALVGAGWTLAALSGLLVAIGRLFRNPVLAQAGWRGWLAHAVTAVLVQVLKHGIGRPRPRLHREIDFFTGPQLGQGFDSFPSGHASASFAVAGVIARFYPSWAWPAWTLAGFVSLTRVIRGSHFVSDVVAGVVLGLVVGTLAASPPRTWQAALGPVLLAATSWLILACVVAWLACWPVASVPAAGLLVLAGALALTAHRIQAVVRGSMGPEASQSHG